MIKEFIKGLDSSDLTFVTMILCLTFLGVVVGACGALSSYQSHEINMWKLNHEVLVDEILGSVRGDSSVG